MINDWLTSRYQASDAHGPVDCSANQNFETQYGIDWWKVMGLIPGPSQPGDWVERWWGDSSRTFYVPQQFWDPRGCASSGEKLARPRSGLHDHPDTKGEVR